MIDYLHIRTYVGSDKPTLKLFNHHIRATIAPHWYDLGVELLKEGSVDRLNIIKSDHLQSVEKCCTEMFMYWLRVDKEASWNKLINALQRLGQNTLAANIKKNILKGIFISYCS